LITAGPGVMWLALLVLFNCHLPRWIKGASRNYLDVFDQFHCHKVLVFSKHGCLFLLAFLDLFADAWQPALLLQLMCFFSVDQGQHQILLLLAGSVCWDRSTD
jgi:hypothetical protein